MIATEQELRAHCQFQIDFRNFMYGKRVILNPNYEKHYWYYQKESTRNYHRRTFNLIRENYYLEDMDQANLNLQIRYHQYDHKSTEEEEPSLNEPGYDLYASLVCREELRIFLNAILDQPQLSRSFTVYCNLREHLILSDLTPQEFIDQHPKIIENDRFIYGYLQPNPDWDENQLILQLEIPSNFPVYFVRPIDPEHDPLEVILPNTTNFSGVHLSYVFKVIPPNKIRIKKRKTEKYDFDHFRPDDFKKYIDHLENDQQTTKEAPLKIPNLIKAEILLLGSKSVKRLVYSENQKYKNTRYLDPTWYYIRHFQDDLDLEDLDLSRYNLKPEDLKILRKYGYDGWNFRYLQEEDLNHKKLAKLSPHAKRVLMIFKDLLQFYKSHPSPLKNETGQKIK